MVKRGPKLTPVKAPNKSRSRVLSREVHRIGYHFPSFVVADICMETGMILSRSGKVLPYFNADDTSNKDVSMQDQQEIYKEARDAILDLFPSIPEKDLNKISLTAFTKVRSAFPP